MVKIHKSRGRRGFEKILFFVLSLVFLFSFLVFSFTQAVNSNGQAASLVIGQTDEEGGFNYSSSTLNNPINIGLNQPNDSAIDNVNHKFYIADTNNNRVLVYDLNSDNTFPDYKADYVVGQPDFFSTSENQGGDSPTSQSLRQPMGVAVEPSTGDLYVSDTGNNRVLIFSSVSSNNPTANYVIGASDFVSVNSSGLVSNSTMLSPVGVAFSGSGVNLKIYIADKDFNRVLIFSQITTNGQPADLVLGQSSFNTSSASTSRSGLAAPLGLVLDSNNYLYVADSNNNRIMIWTSEITINGQEADKVLGQTWFTSNTPGTSRSTLRYPYDVGLNSSGYLYVTDKDNHRVLIWTEAISTNGQEANYVLGQSNFTSNGSGVSSTMFNSPRGIVVCDSKMFFADSGNNRVGAYTTAISSNGQAMNFVIGQLKYDDSVDFYSNAINNPQRSGLNSPRGVAVDSIHHKLFVVDQQNNRVLVFELSVDNELTDYVADYVLGQPSFSSTDVNHNGVSSSSLNLPSDVFYDSINQRLYVVDTNNNRVLVWTKDITENGQSADLVLGQSTMTSNTAGVTDSSLASPQSISVNTATNAVAVADKDNNRVLIWNSRPDSSGQPADLVLGQSDFNSNSYGTSQSALHVPRGVAYDPNTGYLYVADTNNNRVLVWTSTITTHNQPADIVLGQDDFVTSVAGSPVAADTMNFPNEVYVNPRSSAVYVADSGNNRVLVWTQAITTNGQGANLVVGQADFSTSGAATSQTGLNNPGDIVVMPDNGVVLITDTGNNRVLGYDNAAPNIPSLSGPENGATDVSCLPSFYATASDPDGDALQYKIEVAQDVDFTVDYHSFDQTVSAENWTGQTIGNTYSLSATAGYETSSSDTLYASTQYYWRAYAYDPFGSQTWTEASDVYTFTTVPANGFAFVTPQRTVVAGQVSEVITIRLEDPMGNPVRISTPQTVYLFSSSAAGSFSATADPFVPVTQLTIPAGANSVSFYYKDENTGNPQITVSDASPADGDIGLDDSSQTISVINSTMDHFEWSVIGNQTAGVSFTATINAVDQFGNIVPAYSNTVEISSTPSGVNPNQVTISSGTWTGNLTVYRATPTYLTVTDVEKEISNNSNTFNVGPGPIHHVSPSVSSLEAKAGADHILSAVSYDQYNNPLDNGDVSYSWSLASGLGSLSPTDQPTTTYTAASQINEGLITVQATETITVSADISVTIIPHHYSISTISEVSAGDNIAVDIEAQDANNLLITNCDDIVDVSDLSGTISPVSVALVSGLWSGNFIITKAFTSNRIDLTAHNGQVTGQSNTFDVVPNVLDHVNASEDSFSLSVGTTKEISAQAYDEYDNEIAGLTYNWNTTIGSVPLSGNPVVFEAGTTSGNGTLTVSVTQNSITVSDNVNVTVTSLDVSYFEFANISNQIAGQGFVITIMAKDQYGNTVTSYTGNGIISYSAGSISPSQTSDFTSGSWTGVVTVTKAATSASLSFNDGSHSGTSNTFAVEPSDLDHVSVSPTFADVNIGGEQLFVASAYDQYDNQITTNLTITWSLANPNSGTLSSTTNVSTTFTASTVAGLTNLNVSIVRDSIEKTSFASINVLPDPLDHFDFNEISSPQTIETPFTLKITAKDQYDNVVTSFTDLVNLSDLTGDLTPTQTTGFSEGVWEGTVSISTVFTDDVITATYNNISSSTNKFDIISDVLDHVVITPSNVNVTVGNSLGFTAQAYDQFNNVVTNVSYQWSVINGVGSVAPATGLSTTFTASTATGTGIVRVAATQGSVTVVADATVEVVPGSLHHFVFNSISDKVAGEQFTLEVAAKDQYNNTVTNFSDVVALSDSAGGISPTSIGPFVSGEWSGTVMLTKAGLVTITATYGAISTNSDQINVSPADLHHVIVDPDPVVVTVGHTQLVVAQAQDQYNNDIEGAGYSWSVTSNVGQIDADDQKEVNLTASHKTATGILTVTAVSGTLTADLSVDVEVVADELAQFQFSQINSPQLAGTPFQINLTAQDQYGNTVSNFNSSVQLSDDTNTISPTETGNFINGIWSGTITITQSIEENRIQAIYGSITSQSNPFEVKAVEGQVYLNIVSGNNQKTAVGTEVDEPLVVKAVDQYNNPIKGLKIQFSVSSYPVDATGYELSNTTLETDIDGTAQVEFKVGNKVGTHLLPQSY